MIQVIGYRMEVPPPKVIFDGTNGTDVKGSLFLYDNVVMRGKSDDENAVTLYAYLEKDARSAY